MIDKREPPIVAGRVPPHDLDAEAAVLSTILLKGRNALAEVGDVLAERDFYSESNGEIYGAAWALDEESKPIDAVTIGSWLRARERLAKVGGVGYLMQIVDATPAVANVREHALIVQSKARVRRMISECQLISAEGYGDVGEVSQWIDLVEARVCAVADDAVNVESAPQRAGEILRDMAIELRDQAVGESGVRIPTNIPDLNRLLKGGGLGLGGMTAVGAFWGVGKTSWAVGLATSVALLEHRAPGPRDEAGEARGYLTGTAFFSLEMPRKDLMNQAVSQIAKVDAMKEPAARNQDEWRDYTMATEAIARSTLWIDDISEHTPTSLRSSLRRIKIEARKSGVEIRLVVVDYLQLLDGKTHLGKKASREEEVAYIARSLKLMARAENVHVIALAQLNDDATKRAKDKRPRSSDFRESKAIPMNADNCLLIHNPFARARALARRDGHTAEEAPSSEVVELILDKNRGGRMGTVRALFHPPFTLFTGYDGREYAEPEAM